MSRYLSKYETFDRLKNEWSKYGKLIIAYDVDSTVLPFHEDEKDDNYTVIHKLIRKLHELGCILVVFTSAEENRWDEIKERLKEKNLPYHYFNQSPPEIPNIIDKGKVYANIYLDDRASLYESVKMLQDLIIIRENKS